MRKIIIVILLLLNICAFSQKANYSINLKYCIPYIKGVEDYSATSIPEIKLGNIETYSSKSGGQIGGRINYPINSIIFIEGGLQLNLIRFQQTTEIINPSFSSYTGRITLTLPDSFFVGLPYGPINPPAINIKDSDDIGKTTLLYMSIPISIGSTFFNNKLDVKAGISASFLAYGQVYKYVSYYSLNTYSRTVEKDKSADGFTNLVFDGTIEIEYLIYKNIELNLGYNYSFNSIYDKNASVGKPKYNIFSVGLTYNLI